MKKKILSIMLVVAIVLSFVPVVGQAAMSGTCGDNMSYALDDAGTLIIYGEGKMIDSPEFCGNEEIRTVIIENGVANIGSRAFIDCNNLVSVTIPDSVTSIDEYAFQGCVNLTNITIPQGVTNIGDQAFCECHGLNSIEIPDGVTNIGSSAFYDTAIYNNENNWIDGFLYIGKHLIDVSLSIRESVTSCNIREGTKTIAGDTFNFCSNLESVVMPDSLISIGDGAFNSCTRLKNIIIPNGLISIGEYAFYDCYDLTDIHIPDNVINIGRYTFYNCRELTNVTIGKGVTSIGESTFKFCNKLTSVTIPDSITSIGVDAFDRCSNLTYVHYTGTKKEWDNIQIDDNNSCLMTATLFCRNEFVDAIITTSEANVVGNYISLNVQIGEDIPNKALIAVLYNEEMLPIDCKTIAYTSSNSANLLLKNDKTASYIKVFIWDSIDSMYPIARVEQFKIN